MDTSAFNAEALTEPAGETVGCRRHLGGIVKSIVYDFIKIPQSFFCEKRQLPRQREPLTDNRKGCPYGMIYNSIRAKHPLLFTFHSSLPVRTFATALLCLIFAYASYFFACRVNILEYRTHTCQQKNTEMTKNISVISAIFLLNFKPLTLCLCAAEEPLKFSAFSRPQCRI